MEIEEISYEFDPDAVLVGIETDIYDFDASVARYIDLCKSAIRKAYPASKIQIRKASDIRTSFLINGENDHSHISHLETICDKVWNAEDDYKIKHADIVSIRDAEQFVTIDTICEEFDTSFSLLRWSCRNQLIKEANRNALIWLLTRLNFHNFQRIFLKGRIDTSIWKIKYVGEQVASISGFDHVEFLQQRIIDMVTDKIMILIESNMVSMPKPFGTNNSYILVSNTQNTIKVTVELFDDIERWEYEFAGFGEFRDALCKQAPHNKNCRIRRIEENTGKKKTDYSLAIDFVVEEPQENFERYINKHLGDLHKLVEDAHIQLAKGLPWHQKYENDEKEFHKYLQKLVTQLDYEVVKLEHGSFEFGKDILFADTTSFGIRRYYAIQAKKGDLSGGAKSDIDEILTQMEDAFSVPFQEDQTLEHKYISAFVIAISGEFTHNAKEKIWARLLRLGRVGMVYFWDKNVVQDLMRKGSHQIKDLPVHSLQSMMPDFLDQKESKERK